MDITPDTLRKLGIPTQGLVYPRNLPPYNPSLTKLARELRNHGTMTEAMMWKVIKNGQTGYTFTRQKPILNFIADFYCHELNVVVEIDGATHLDDQTHLNDCERDRQMQSIGIHVVRILDTDVRRNPTASAQYIFSALGLPIPDL